MLLQIFLHICIYRQDDRIPIKNNIRLSQDGSHSATAGRSGSGPGSRDSGREETGYACRCYSIFVQKTRDYYAESQNLTQAIRRAIAYCRTHDLMADYFAENEKEVFDMVNFKWDQKRALEIAEEDGVAKGRAEGRAEGREEGLAEGRADKRRAILGIALSLLRKGMPVDFIAETTQLSLKEVQKLARDNGLAF
ncbi:hypothetical protein [Mitsuokella sp. WILCCON 0060]|uniref:hypothetical protein n=1 Tax=unclassified Mitsuokella TaxID=2637239 RepID=UPI003EFDF744